jgi:hypothetical protein
VVLNWIRDLNGEDEDPIFAWNVYSSLIQVDQDLCNGQCG